jgi:hypothetical protein
MKVENLAHQRPSQCISSRRVVLGDTHPFQGGGGGKRKESQGSNVFKEPGQIFSALPPPPRRAERGSSFNCRQAVVIVDAGHSLAVCEKAAFAITARTPISMSRFMRPPDCQQDEHLIDSLRVSIRCARRLLGGIT